LSRALVVGAGGGWRSLDLIFLSPLGSGRGEIVAAVDFHLTPRAPDEVKRTVADLNARRKAAQPTNRRTFGSVFKNPDHELGAGQMLDSCGLKGHTVGGARISPRHANFIENVDGATAVDALALMGEARRRAFEVYGVTLEHEVELLGGLQLPLAADAG
jgi:UDP-N-acetylmuramate dehydrogenase